VNRLRQQFEQQDRDIAVYNCGVCGDTTVDVMRRFESEIQTRSGTDDEQLVVIFAIGINDTVINLVHGLPMVPL
jgi:hypothetical protein